jgi:cyanophycin synthetase
MNGAKVILDYCHNVDGMRRLTEFVGLMMAPGDGAPANGRAIGVIGIPGDRREEDMREYGRLAAHAFDTIYVREDANLRGRQPGETAEHVLAGIRQAQSEGGRCVEASPVLLEPDAAQAGLTAAQPGDLVVMCVDDAAMVYRSVMQSSRKGGRGVAIADPGELDAEEG